MEQRKRKNSKRSQTKIIPPKRKNTESLSRDEVRSINKKKIRRKRKAKRIALLMALAVTVISVGIVLVLSVFFKISTVTVKGDKVYSDKEVTLKSGIEVGDNLFRVSEEELNEKLAKALPYIDKVTLERQLPDTVIITVTATREVAALQAGSGFVLIDHTGKVLDKDASMLRESVAVVTGVTPKNIVEGEKIALGKEDITNDFITLLNGIKESKINLLTEINITKTGEYELRYDDRITIKLGTVDNIAVKLQRAMAAIEKENEINSYSEGVLDLKTEPYAYFSPGEEETTGQQKPSDQKGENPSTTDVSGAETTENSEVGNSQDNENSDE